MTDYVYWVRGSKHAELAELSIRSVKAVDPEGRCYVYTDDPLLGEVEGAVMCRWPAGEPAMVANLTAQLRHLQASDPFTKVLFLDADVLLKAPFPFASAELYPTWRDHIAVQNSVKVGGHIIDTMPYNYGVLGAVSRPATIEAFTWMRQRVLTMAVPHQHWYGNQFALFELAGHPSRDATEAVPISWTPADRAPRLLVHRLPCEIYNYTPEAPGEDVTGKVALHFKGGRKDLMEAYL